MRNQFNLKKKKKKRNIVPEQSSFEMKKHTERFAVEIVGQGERKVCLEAGRSPWPSPEYHSMSSCVIHGGKSVS